MGQLGSARCIQWQLDWQGHKPGHNTPKTHAIISYRRYGDNRGLEGQWINFSYARTV